MDGAGFFAAERRWQVGCVTYDEGSRELRVAGERRPIEAKPLQLLLRLLEAEGKIVCQRDLLIAAWGNAEIPTLTSLQTAISKLRRVLGPEETGLIEVASGQGYRLTKPALCVAKGAVQATPDDAPMFVPAPRRVGPLPAAALVAAALFVVALSAVLAWQAGTTAARAVAGGTAAAGLLADDLIAQAEAGRSDRPNETLLDALLRLEPMITARLGDTPAEAAPAYASLAVTLESRGRFTAARSAYEHAEHAFAAAEGPDSPHAVVLMLRQASMELRDFDRGNLARAERLVTIAEPKVAGLSSRQIEARVWLLTAQGMTLVMKSRLADALQDFTAAADMAAANPGAFDEAARFLFRFRVGFAHMKLGHHDVAQGIFSTLAGEAMAAHGALYPDTLNARLGLAQNGRYGGDAAGSIRQLQALLPDLQSVFGRDDRRSWLAQAALAQALMQVERYDDAARLSLDLAGRVSSVQGANAVYATSLRGLAGDAMCRAGHYADGERLMRASYATLRATLGDAHPATQSAPPTIATCLVLAGRPLEAKPLLAGVNCDALGDLMSERDYCADIDVLRAAVAHAEQRDDAARPLVAHAMEVFSAHSGDAIYRQIAAGLMTR